MGRGFARTAGFEGLTETSRDPPKKPFPILDNRYMDYNIFASSYPKASCIGGDHAQLPCGKILCLQRISPK